jgi:hypothetical protein
MMLVACLSGDKGGDTTDDTSSTTDDSDAPVDTEAPEAEDCADGTDNDGDGLVDCEDGDCVGQCTEVCDDGVDNDGDGDTDCDDLDCCWVETQVLSAQQRPGDARQCHARGPLALANLGQVLLDFPGVRGVRVLGQQPLENADDLLDGGVADFTLGHVARL